MRVGAIRTLSPFRGSLIFPLATAGCPVGCILSPLRGWQRANRSPSVSHCPLLDSRASAISIAQTGVLLVAIGISIDSRSTKNDAERTASPDFATFDRRSASACHANLSQRKAAVRVNVPSLRASPVSSPEPAALAFPAAEKQGAAGAID